MRARYCNAIIIAFAVVAHRKQIKETIFQPFLLTLIFIFAFFFKQNSWSIIYRNHSPRCRRVQYSQVSHIGPVEYPRGISTTHTHRILPRLHLSPSPSLSPSFIYISLSVAISSSASVCIWLYLLEYKYYYYYYCELWTHSREYDREFARANTGHYIVASKIINTRQLNILPRGDRPLTYNRTPQEATPSDSQEFIIQR